MCPTKLPVCPAVRTQQNRPPVVDSMHTWSAPTPMSAGFGLAPHVMNVILRGAATAGYAPVPQHHTL